MTCACSCSSSTTRMVDLGTLFSDMFAFPGGSRAKDLRERQRNRKVAALPHLAADPDRPAVLVGDAFGHGQADPGAALLGRIVGGEDLAERVGGDAGARVDHVDDRIAPPRG